jgi:hypothetical protein
MPCMKLGITIARLPRLELLAIQGLEAATVSHFDAGASAGARRAGGLVLNVHAELHGGCG